MFGRIDTNNIHRYKEINIDWISIVPWAYQEDIHSPQVSYFRDSTQIKKRDSSWISQINIAHNAGYKIFFKPHLWITNDTSGKWRSDIFPTSDQNWELWKKSYAEFIIRNAKIAEKTKVDLFCIGVEFTRLTLEKDDFWEPLIDEIREVYSGKITYAANWYKEFENITFWDKLDYIGIQAYFPLSDKLNPSVEDISKGWDEYIPLLHKVHKKFNKPILFTEVGYKCTEDSAKEPWKWLDYTNRDELKYCPETQSNVYTSLFNTIWKKDWLAGIYIWQMRGDHDPNNERINYDFTPQSKPAETIIKNAFERE